MVYQGKKIRREVPELPEAKEPKGIANPGKAKEISILFIGESTFAGVGAEFHKEGFAGSFAKEYAKLKEAQINWSVYARSGYTIARMRKKLVPKIEERKVDVILVGAGGNDAFTLNRPNKWRIQAIELIRDLQNKYPETPIVFSNMPPIKLFPAFTSSIKFVIGNLVEILGSELKDVVKNYDDVFYNAEIIDLKNWDRLVERKVTLNELFSDGVHPSIFTYEIWGKEMARFVFKNC